MTKSDTKTILALFPCKAKDAQAHRSDANKLHVMDLLNGTQFNLNMASPKGAILND